MKCWECKKEISRGRSIPYIACDKNTGEAYAQKYRTIGDCCYPKIQPLRTSLGYIKVEKITQRKLDEMFKGGEI